jgi:hypothetical protein
MIQQHKLIFFKVAAQFNCIIGVREPNPLADKWIGRAGYTPKMQSCKAKTANNAGHPFAGLVVDPLLCPDAFTEKSLPVAKEKWTDSFLSGGNLPSGFTRETTGDEKGLVKYNGSAIYADYDLMYVSSADAKGEHTFTDYAEQKQLGIRVKAALNNLFGIAMIQHGAEFDWMDPKSRVGAAEKEQVHIFKPRGFFDSVQSAVPKDKSKWH